MNGLPEQRGLGAFQAGFAARIRNPQGAPLQQGVPERRMQVYEELLFNNLEGFLLSCFPITRQLLLDEEWKQLVRGFFIDHNCSSPLFRDIPGEFLRWLRPQVGRLPADKPFLLEFMHYEWLEMEVSICSDSDPVDVETVNATGDPLKERPVLSPSARIACYHYQVHHIGPEYQPRHADEVVHCYLLYRDGEDRVRFNLLNPMTARMLELLQQEEMSGFDALNQVADETGFVDRDLLVRAGKAQLEQLRELEAIVGTSVVSRCGKLENYHDNP